MEFSGILFALLYAVVLTLIFAWLFKNTGPWPGFWAFSLLIFLVALAVGEWAIPTGPSAWGYHWVPGLIASVILALVLAAVKPAARSISSINKDISDVDQANEQTALVITLFFWIVVIVLILIGVGGMLWNMLHIRKADLVA